MKKIIFHLSNIVYFFIYNSILNFIPYLVVDKFIYSKILVIDVVQPIDPSVQLTIWRDHFPFP